MKYIIYLSLIFAILSSCQKDEYWKDGDYLYLTHKNATMPVWVRGNIKSGIFLFTIHGGPTTASGHEFTLSAGFAELEKDYAVVYWDQRESGIAQGRPQKEVHTVEQYTEDAEKVFELIKERYFIRSIFLLGHSWGGAIGHTLLLDRGFQNKVDGWILLDGMSNDPREISEMKRWTLEKAEARIAENKNVEFWQFCKQWYQENPHFSSIAVPPYHFAVAAGGDIYSRQAYEDSAAIDYPRLIFSSPFSTDYLFSLRKGTEVDFTGWSVADRLHEITLPTMIAWGEHDGIIPVTLAYECYDLYGTPEKDLRLEIFNRSAHSPHFDEPLTFSIKLREFIEQYKEE